MAKKIFTAAELRARTNLSGKVAMTYERIMNTLVNLADNGVAHAKVDVDRNISDAIVRKLIGDGFKAEFNPNYGKVEISWNDERKEATNNFNETRVENSISNVPAKNIPTCKREETHTSDKADGQQKDEPRTTQTNCRCGKEAKSDKKRDTKPKAPKRVDIRNSVVFENCVFNITVPINVHHFGVRKNNVDKIIK